MLVSVDVGWSRDVTILRLIEGHTLGAHAQLREMLLNRCAIFQRLPKPAGGLLSSRVKKLHLAPKQGAILHNKVSLQHGSDPRSSTNLTPQHKAGTSRAWFRSLSYRIILGLWLCVLLRRSRRPAPEAAKPKCAFSAVPIGFLRSLVLDVTRLKPGRSRLGRASPFSKHQGLKNFTLFHKDQVRKPRKLKSLPFAWKGLGTMMSEVGARATGVTSCRSQDDTS